MLFRALEVLVAEFRVIQAVPVTVLLVQVVVVWVAEAAWNAEGCQWVKRSRPNGWGCQMGSSGRPCFPVVSWVLRIYCRVSFQQRTHKDERCDCRKAIAMCHHKAGPSATTPTNCLGDQFSPEMGLWCWFQSDLPL